MRIISGIYKGRRLPAKLPSGIRPTQDALRETIFNVLLNHIDITGLRVVDLCAGAGMFGLEALSRGASFVYFVDKSYKSLEYVRAVLQLLSVSELSYSIHNLDALQFINHAGHSQAVASGEFSKIDLLFLDPPYNSNVINEVLLRIKELDIMQAGGIMVIETAIHNNLIMDNNFTLLSVRQHGAAKVYFIRS